MVDFFIGFLVAALVVFCLRRQISSWLVETEQKVSGCDGKVALLERQLADAGTAAEVEGDILAVCAAREWEIKSTLKERWRDRYRLSLYLTEPQDAENAALKDWWTVGAHAAPSLAEAWDRACAHYDLETKLKAKHGKPTAEPTP